MAPEPRRGEVWLAEVDKLRPVVVLTRDPMGRHLNDVIVAPVTSRIRGLSTEVAVGAGEGLRTPSVVNLDHIQLLGRDQLRRAIGQLPAEIMHEVCGALAIAVDCEPSRR